MALHVVDVKEEYRECTDLKYCLCAEYDNKICKFKITFNDMDVYLFEVVDEDSLENKAIAKKFFPYLGKFRLEGRFKSTNNYFAPSKQSELLSLLFSMYKTNILNEKDFEYIAKLYTLSDNDNILNFIKKMFSKANIKLIGECALEELNTHLNFLEIKFSEIRFSDTYISLKRILESSKENRESINKLGLNDYFIEAIKRKKEETSQLQKQKHN